MPIVHPYIIPVPEDLRTQALLHQKGDKFC